MENSTCFLSSFGGISGERLHCQLHRRLCGKMRIPHSYRQEKKRLVLHCLHDNDQTEGQAEGQNPSLEEKIHNVVRLSMTNPADENQLKESNRRIMDGITETGVKEIEDIANDVKGEFEDLQRLVEENADKLIEEETRQVLESYNQKQKELLGVVEKDRQIITTEIERIKELAKKVDDKSGLDRRKTLREKAYFVMCLIFTVSAVYYAWAGFVDSDVRALTNAGIDATVAAACTYFYSKESARK